MGRNQIWHKGNRHKKRRDKSRLVHKSGRRFFRVGAGRELPINASQHSPQNAEHYFNALHLRLNGLYNCGCDDCKTITLSTPLSFGEGLGVRILNAGKKAFKRLHEKGSYTPEDLKTEKAYKDLINQTFEAFNFAITDNDMPELMRTALQDDAFLFGGLKTHAQLFEASKRLLDDKGNLKPFNTLSQEFDKLNVKYNKNYLEAEYEFAVGASQMAAKWTEFSDSDRYELQYRTAGDNRVRDEHAALNNITLPKSDPFWDSYTPPNGWNCRCTTVEVLKDKYEGGGYLKESKKAIAKGESATSQIGKDGKNRLAIFRFNPGKQKILFPPAHPYGKVKGAKEVGPIILTMINKPNSEWSILKKYKNGGLIEAHSLVDKKSSDYKSIKQCCNHFAKTGAKTEILPKVHSKSEAYKTIYKDLIGTKYEGKCPDFRVDGKYYELEGFEGNNPKKALKNMLNRGEKQSSRIVITDCGVTESYLIRNIKNRIFIDKKHIEEVWNLKDNKLSLVYKNAKTP